MKTLPLLAIIMLLLSPAVGAYDQIINVQDDQEYSQVFPDQTATRTYQFSLNNNFFNVTSNLTDDKAVWEAIIRAQIKEEGQISSTNDYTISFMYNGTFELVYHLEYIRHGLGRWERIYGFNLYNGTTPVTSCTTGEGFPVFLGGTTPAPNPWIVFQYNLNGRFGTAPSLYISFGDDQQGDKTCNIPTSIGGGIQIPMGELTAVPSVTMRTVDAELYTDKLTYEFDTRRHELIEQENFNLNISSQGCEQTFIIFGICNLINGMETAISFTFGFVKGVLGTFVGVIPFGSQVYEAITLPLNIAGEAIVVLLNIFFITDGEHGLGAIWWAHVIYFLSLGVLTASITGNLLHIIIFPMMFIKWSALALFYVVRFFFVTLPLAIWQLIALLLPG